MSTDGSGPAPARGLGVALVVAGVAGLVWFALFLQQPLRGYDDTDDPAVGIRFVTEQPGVWQAEALAAFVLATSLAVAAPAVRRWLRDPGDDTWLDGATAIGLAVVALFLGYGSVRVGMTGPVLHLAGLDAGWGESAYLAGQMAGVQGFLPAALLGLSAWVASISVLAWRRRGLPLALVVLGLVPALRVAAALLVPLGVDLGFLWIGGVLAIPLAFVWALVLGGHLAWRTRSAAVLAPA